MPMQLFENNAISTLSVAVTTNSQATLTLQSGHGARFPTPAPPDYFYVTLDDGTNVEVCLALANSSDVLTVLRGQEGTTAQSSFSTGTRVALRMTKDSLRYIAHRFIHDTSALKPVTNTASWAWLGMQLPTQVGSVRSVAATDSSWRETQPRIRIGTINSAQNPVHWRVPSAMVNVGRGFRYVTRFGAWIVPNSSHFFIGLVNTTGAVTSVHPPSSLTQAITVGWANAGGQPNLSIWRNDGSGNAVQLDLGSYFTANSTAWYEVEFFAIGSQTRIDYRVRRLDVSSIADASSFFTADIPTNSSWLSPYMNGATMVASAMQVDLGFCAINN